MMNIRCEEAVTVKKKNDFLKLPNILYDKSDNPRDYKTEQSLLYNSHNLSRNFTITPLVVYKDNKISARCIVTEYSRKNELYFGFFDSINDQEVVNQLINTVKHIAKRGKYTKIVGPLDCSFWIGYRLKIDNFDTHYTCEPYNKDYYFELLKNCGFNVCDEYVSNHFKIIPDGYVNDKYKGRLDRLYDRGYEIKDINSRNFNKSLIDIYYLINKLYSDFPTYSEITKQEFIMQFKSLKYIIDYSMIKLIYKNNKLVAFFINLPNYNNLINNITLNKLVKMLKIKKNPKEYVLLYMGVDTTALGLGAALAELIKNELCNKKCTSIGALIHKGKITSSFYNELIDNKYHYVLLEINVSN